MVDSGLRSGKDDRIHNGWKMVKKNVEKVSDLVKDILYASKEREPEYQECDPGSVLQDVCSLYQDKAESAGIKIIRKFAPEMGSWMLDPKGIHNAISNLVSNAIEACRNDCKKPNHSVEIAAIIDQGNLFIKVSDNGTGMPEEVRQNLFKKFYSTKGSGGTGLGLVVTRKIVEEHGGSIRVESSLGEGSTFFVEIPLRSFQQQNLSA